MFGLESFMMQLNATDIQAFSTSIVAMATALAAIVGIAAKFIQTHTNNSKLRDWTTIVANDSQAIKQSLQATDQWILENQAKFTAGFALVNSMLTPEQQKALQAQGVNIQQWTKDLDEARKELDTIYGVVPAAAAVKTKVPDKPI